MKRTNFAWIIAALAAGLAPGTGLTDPLPKTAKPIGAAALTKYYSGVSIDWKTSKAHFAPDGTVKGINTGTGTSVFWGKWTVKGNEVCMVNSWKNLGTGDTGSGATDCWKWYVDADGTYWTLWSVHYDGSKPKADDYYTGEADKIRRGDTVSKKFDKLYR